MNKKEMKRLQSEIDRIGKERAKESGKMWGECVSCGTTTVLVEVTNMCGPCTWGEAETIGGNW